MDDTNGAASAAANDSLRADLEEAWDRLSAEPEPEDIPPGDEDDAPPEDDADTAVAPLAHWPAEWRERFQALPEEAKPYALDLHRQFEKAHSDRSQALAEREKELDGLRAVDAALAPWRETMHSQGLTDGEAVKRLMDARAALERDPGAALSAIAESYGVAPPAGAAPAPGHDPARQPDRQAVRRTARLPLRGHGAGSLADRRRRRPLFDAAARMPLDRRQRWERKPPSRPPYRTPPRWSRPRPGPTGSASSPRRAICSTAR